MKTLRNVSVAVLAVAACGLLAGTAFAAPGNTATANATAGGTIECAITLSLETENAFDANMEFGDWFQSAGNLGGTVVLQACEGPSDATVISSPNGLTQDPDGTHSPNPAELGVVGQATEPFSVTVVGSAAGVITLTRVAGSGSGGSTTETVDTITICTDNQECLEANNFTSTGVGTWSNVFPGAENTGCHCNDFLLGGTWHVGANDNGRYEGPFTVTVSYT